MNDIIKRILLILEFFYLVSFCCLLLFLFWMGGAFIHSLFLTYDFNFFAGRLDSLDDIFIIIFIYAPAYIFLKWLLTGNFQIVPENLRNFFKAKNIVIILTVFSVFTLGTGIKGYVDYNSTKENPIATTTSIPSLAKELYFQGSGNGIASSKVVKNYQGLICNDKATNYPLRIYIYEIHNKQKYPPVRRKVAHYTETKDAFDNKMYKRALEDITTSDTQFSYKIKAGYEFPGISSNATFEIVINRNTLELVVSGPNMKRYKSSYQCQKTNYKEIEDYVKNHNDNIKSKRQL